MHMHWPWNHHHHHHDGNENTGSRGSKLAAGIFIGTQVALVGLVTLGYFADSMVIETPERQREKTEKLIKKFDTDGDEKLSQTELYRAIREGYVGSK